MSKKKLSDYLPEKFRDIKVWKDLADTFESEIFDVNNDSCVRVRNLREVTKADADQLYKVKELMGVPISVDTFTEQELRRLLETITYWFETSGTRFFIDILRFVKNAEVELFELYTNRDIVGEVLASGDGVTTSFAGNLSMVPIDTFAGKIIITDGTQTIQDDGSGNFTGDGTGSVDYNSGVYTFTFNTATISGTNNITSDYYTHRYMDFVKEVSAGPLTKDGGDFYLTNQVGLVFDLETFSQSNLTELFYQIASTVLVLRVLEGLLSGYNSVPLQYVGEGHIESSVIGTNHTSSEFRNIIKYRKFIEWFIHKLDTVGIEASDQFEEALLLGPDRIIIPKHLYVVGSVISNTPVIGDTLSSNIDSLGPSVESAIMELPEIYDSGKVQDFFFSDSLESNIVPPYRYDTSSYSAAKPSYNYEIGQTDLDTFVVKDHFYDRLHPGQIDIGFVFVEPYASSQFYEEYINWLENIISAGTRISYLSQFTIHGIEPNKASVEVQVRFRDSTVGSWSSWKSLKGNSELGRYVQKRVVYSKEAGGLITGLFGASYGEIVCQVDVRDRYEQRTHIPIPEVGVTINFQNEFVIIPSTQLFPSVGEVVVDSKDKQQITLHLEDSYRNSISGSVTAIIRGY